MWSNVDHAQLYFNQCYQIADIILPGLDDHQALYNHQNYDDIVKFFEALGKKELVIKAGESGVFGCSANGESFHVPFVAAPKQVDATAAGDSFAGTYLAARLNNVGIQQSIQEAAKVAGVVVQHPGAIIDESIVIQ